MTSETPKARAQRYINTAVKASAATFPRPDPVATAPRERGRMLLLYCPGQGGWHTGEWHQGEWTDALTRRKHLKPTHWMEAPPDPK